MNARKNSTNLPKYHFSSVRLFLALIIFGLSLVTAEAVHAAVTLRYFIAEGQDGMVVITWETESELSNVGFYILRSLERDRGYLRISDFIPTQSDGVNGSFYQYIDSRVNNGITYWYKLESIDDGQRSTVHGPPDSATPRGPAIPTSTTSPVTATPTRGPTTPTSKPDQSATPIKQSTSTTMPAYPAPATSTAVVNTEVPGQVTETQEITATATIIPLPTIVMEFPSDQSTTVGVESTQTIEGTQSTFSSTLASRRVAFIAGLLLFWLILIGLLVYFLRRIK